MPVTVTARVDTDGVSVTVTVTGRIGRRGRGRRVTSHSRLPSLVTQAARRSNSAAAPAAVASAMKRLEPGRAPVAGSVGCRRDSDGAGA